MVIRLGSLLLCVVCLAQALGEETELTLAQAKARFDKADRALNEAWSLLQKSVVPELFGDLRIAQRRWIDSRLDVAAYDAGFSKRAQAGSSPEYYRIAADMTERRAEFLRRIAEQKDTTIPGVWGNGFGTTIEVVKRDDRILFRFIETEIGTLAGVAAWNDRIGWFSDRGQPYQEATEANICFIWRAWKLEIVSANTRHYFGKNAPIDGIYYKIGELSEEKVTELTKAAEAGEYELK